MIYQLDLDCVDQGDLSIWLGAVEMYYGLETEILTENGPAGCSLVRFIGEENNIWDLLYLEYTSEDEDEADFLMSHAKELG